MISLHEKKYKVNLFFICVCVCVLFLLLFLFDGNGNITDENGSPKHMEYVIDHIEFVVEAIATRTDYSENATSSEPLNCPMQIEKPIDEDIHMKEASIKGDYV